MPTTIYRRTPPGEKHKDIASLCDDVWELPAQTFELEVWLSKNREKLEPADYVADIGYTPREGAMGGGAALSPEMLRTMADLGMWLFLSEYPVCEDDD
ncbi:hypothetical protein [Verrucomicrobium sp. BvORR106]|uniref:hypothetical protein n=1 Tax=Verrucomicrobium sp. BvORR106 TaxID=1403819 RepID=UPI0005717EC7|nr:hypothetical protein [Verrucomicrobium sp. BvORR106]